MKYQANHAWGVLPTGGRYWMRCQILLFHFKELKAQTTNTEDICHGIGLLMLSFGLHDNSVGKCNSTDNNILLEKIDDRIVQHKLSSQQVTPLLMKWLQTLCLPSFSSKITVANKHATAISSHSHCHRLYRSFSPQHFKIT